MKMGKQVNETRQAFIRFWEWNKKKLDVKERERLFIHIYILSNIGNKNKEGREQKKEWKK